MRPVLLVTNSNFDGAVMEQSLEPLTRRAGDLRGIGLGPVQRVGAKEAGGWAGALRETEQFPIVVVCPLWSTTVEELRPALEDLWAKPSRPRVVLLDLFDQSSSPLLPLLEVVDRYAKKTLLRDRRKYLQPMEGGYIFTDWLARRGEDLRGWQFGSVAPSEDSLGKLRLAWNFTAAQRFWKLGLAGRVFGRRWNHRRTQVNARFAPSADHGDWYQRHRGHFREILERQCSDLRLTPRGRVSPMAYLREQWDSRIVVSPFGYGELCLRDIETVAAGAVLVKPDMSHLEASPALFEAGVTYAPVRWDAEDLAEVVRSLLADEERAQQMVRAAQRRFREYFRSRGWVEDARRVFEGL